MARNASAAPRPSSGIVAEKQVRSGVTVTPPVPPSAESATSGSLAPFLNVSRAVRSASPACAGVSWRMPEPNQSETSSALASESGASTTRSPLASVRRVGSAMEA